MPVVAPSGMRGGHAHSGRSDEIEAACRRIAEENMKLKEKTNEEEERLRRMSTKVTKCCFQKPKNICVFFLGPRFALLTRTCDYLTDDEN
jgi:hypothetical protein